ncbi:MAG: hypothetical protein AB7T06_00780 [Kofleriaceae bacterium]
MRSDLWILVAALVVSATAAAQPAPPPPTPPEPPTTPTPSEPTTTTTPSEPTTTTPSEPTTTTAPIAPAPAPSPATQVPPTQAPPAKQVPAPRAKKREATRYVGIELGTASIGDDRNVYGDGRGKTLVIGFGAVELRLFEYYALEDRSGMFGNAENGRGELGLSTIGSRLSLLQVGPVVVSALIGVAYVRRSHMRSDVDGFESEIASRLQRGLGLQGGIAVGLGGYLRAEARVYPTLWSDLEGDSRVVIDENGTQMVEVISDSPGGMPMTLSIGLGVPF